MKFKTKAIHIGQEPEEKTGAVNVPLYLSSTFQHEKFGKPKGYEYSRTQNPTREALEKSIAALENGKFGLAFASGLAAETAVMHLFKPHDHIVSGDDIYGGTYRLFDKIFKNFGIEFSYVDATNPENVKNAIKKNTKMVWLETPTNPLMKIADINAVAEITREKHILLVVDNTFASPYFQKPLDLGADISLHSTTKYLGGHSDVIGGALVLNSPVLYEKLKFLQNATGSVPGILDSYLILRSVKTLGIRMEEHEKNALVVAEFLEKHAKVKKVNYPGLKSHPQYAVAKKQMSGFSGMVSFELANIDEAGRFLNNLKIFTLAESLGGVESLACHPATMTHSSIEKEIREKHGITDGLVRLSVGIEDSEDLIADLKQALERA